jgi:sterol desaturase/sphingolipid hydroxylase (fatty acid hydroxylase superfamily)
MTVLDVLIGNEAEVRLLVFISGLALLLALERFMPLRHDARPAKRQARNLGLMLIDTAMLRLAFPAVAVGWAIAVQSLGIGLFARVSWPGWVEIALTVLALDLVIYWQHRILHAVPLLWRLHRVHHSDTAFDVTTGIRFHPLEIALSMGVKMVLIALLGAHPFGVLLFEILLSLGALFTHTDIAFPPSADRMLRWLVVTPSMHRIHHSVIREETDSNFSFHLSVWDRIFRSYRAAPSRDEVEMPIGLNAFRDPPDQTLLALLLQPFRSGERNA